MLKTGIAFCLAILLPLSASAAEQEWRFRVFLDNKEIGTHDFVIQQREDGLRVKSEADFEYKLLFVKLYDYKHETVETWSGNCLTSIESRTDANGKQYEVSGVLEHDRFVLRGSSGVEELPLCNMTFAYWNPAFLEQDRLINVQNGDMVDVVVSAPERVEIMVRGSLRKAFRYRLQAGEMEIELWYSENNEWLALESEARGGRRLRYELI